MPDSVRDPQRPDAEAEALRLRVEIERRPGVTYREVQAALLCAQMSHDGRSRDNVEQFKRQCNANISVVEDILASFPKQLDFIVRVGRARAARGRKILKQIGLL